MNREKRWQDQAERVNPNLWPSLSAKPKSPVIILFPVIFFFTQMEETCFSEHRGGVESNIPTDPKDKELY